MPKLSFTRHVPYSPEQMLSLVADVKSYPDFVPFCSDMQIREGETKDISYARMCVQFGPIAQAYTSKVFIDKQAKTIRSDAIDGPFTHLKSIWKFEPESRGTLIELNIDFGFSNRLLGKIAEPIFAQKQKEILDGFMQEAKRRFA